MNTELRDKALNLLSYRAHSRRELSDKLKRKTSCPDQDLEEVLNWLEELGFLNDKTYAASVVRHATSKSYGISRITAELSRRGIATEFWDEALAEIPEDDDTLDRLVRSKLRDAENRDEVRKVSAALVRRGYTWDEVRRAIERVGQDVDTF